MIKSIILQASIFLCIAVAFGQVEQTTAPVDILKVYGCSAPITKSVPTIYTEQVIQEVQRTQSVLDITDPEISGLVASPNPSKGHLSVSVPVSLIGYQIAVLDMTGRVVGIPREITGTTENLNIEGESGVYLIVIRTEKEIITERIILDTH